MLGKVMKHDFRAVGRLLLPLFGLGVASSIVIRILIAISPYMWRPIEQALTSTAASLGVLVVCAISLLTTVIVVMRYYQTFASTQGYLTFSLPVSINTHLWSRLLVSTLSLLASFFVSLICALIIIPKSFSTIMEVLRQISAEYFTVILLWCLLLFGFLIVATVTSLLHFYLSIAIGTQFGRHRIGGSVLSYFILNTVESIVTMPLISAIFMGIFGNDGIGYNWFYWYDYSGLNGLQAAWHFLGVFAIILGISSAISLILGAAKFLVTKYIFTKRINLE